MDIQSIPGTITKHEIMLYTISTCIWCKRLKNKLNAQNIQYKYLDIDLMPWAEKEELKRELIKHRPRLAFPMMFVDTVFIPNDEIDQKIEWLVREG